MSFFRKQTKLVCRGLVPGVLLAVSLAAQNRPQANQPPPTPKAAAPVDLTGYWVSVITEDWRFRMVLPLKGDYAGVPLNPLGRKTADTWDPAKDEADGNQCKAYGAVNLLRVPGRLHITWQDDQTLRLDADAGTQTRIFHFSQNAPANAAASWQGESVAAWQTPGTSRGKAPNNTGGALKATTTHLKPGYLRINGVPYSDKASLTEYFNVVLDTRGARWMVVTTILEDPTYLTDRYTVSDNFREQKDSSGWNPGPCSAR